MPNETITYGYDELGRRVSTAINGVAMQSIFDAAGRIVSETNALGSFTYAYDGPSDRIISEAFPNGQTTTRTYDDNLHDRALQRVTHQFGVTPISEFIYSRDIPASRIITWSQQSGAAAPDVYTFGYDAADQLLSATVTNTGVLMNHFAYSYDLAGNRLSEQVGNSNTAASYNALNELSTTSGGATTGRTNEWDGKNRLVAVNAGDQRTEFTYDGSDRLASIRLLTNGVQASFRRFVWCGSEICEERDALGTVTKRFFLHGVKIEAGASVGSYFYTRDHLGSIRELVDGGGNARSRYSYDPYGRRTRVTGDLETDVGFTGIFWSSEASLALTWLRAYDPEMGRWLSRDPLKHAETEEGPNLYAYVHDNPVNSFDPFGLRCCDAEFMRLRVTQEVHYCPTATAQADAQCKAAKQFTPDEASGRCATYYQVAQEQCDLEAKRKKLAEDIFLRCELNCKKPKSCPARQTNPAPSGCPAGTSPQTLLFFQVCLPD